MNSALELASGSSSYHPPQPEDPQTMPPDIGAAYDHGESVIFSKDRGCWELYKVLEPTVDLSSAALDLLHLYYLGALPALVHNRLTELFTENPHDISERLERAALHVRQKEKAP